METIEAEDRDAHPDLLRRVRGKTVAVDLSIWIFEATSQRELAEIFTPAGQVAKVVFERACNFLRHGVVPVGVLDGVPPPEKLRRLGLLTAAGAGGGEFKGLGEVARKVLAALGLLAVAAPGEAEATCAALNARGLVDACATGDGDALLFGATTVFKTLKLYADTPELSRLERCESAWIGDALELNEDEHARRRASSGVSEASQSNADDENARDPRVDARAPHRYPGDPGDGSVTEGDAHGSPGVVADALVALATLAGGDYDVGADRVGPTLAARVVRRLAAEARAERAAAAAARSVRDRPGGGGGGGGGVSGFEHDPLESESGVRPNRALNMPMCERLDAFLRLPPDDALAALTQCTGCATCKHAGGGASRKKKCVRGCVACGVAKGEPCVARPDAPCECAFHARTLERWADKARRRARVTEGFAAASRRAAAAYAKQASRAAAAVASLSRAELAWSARPDVPELGRLMLFYCQIPEPRVREKLLPLLLEWDLSRAAPGAAQFAATAIKKMAGAKGAAPWRFLLEVDAADPRERAAAARARERAREVRKAKKVAFPASRPSAGSDEPSSEPSDSASEGPGQAPSADDDDDRPQIEKDLAYFAAKPQTRAVRAELVRAALPELVARFERGGSASTPAKDAEARAAGSARATPRGVPKARAADQRSILGFVTPRKDAEAAPSSRADIHGGLSSKGKEPAAFATPPATLVDVCAATPADGAVATPLEMLTGSSSASLEAAGIPPPKTARRKILDDARFGARLDDGTRATAFRSIGVGVVDLTTPGSDPGESRKAPASARTTPGASPLASPTKRARQAGIKAFLTPKKAAATAPAAGTPAAEVVDLVDSDDTP